MEVSFRHVYFDFLSPYVSKVPFRARFFGVIWIKISYLRSGEWSFKKQRSRKIFVEFHGSPSLAFLRLCASRSPFFSIAKFIHGLSSLSRENLKIPSSIFSFVNDV